MTYQHPDHLSTRLETDSSGNWFRKTGYYPFGENWYDNQNPQNSQTSLAPEWKFTTYEEDSESLNHYAIQRYNSERLGRFLSPDQLAGSLTNPQTLNRYSYTVNSPVLMTDPLGRDACMTHTGMARTCIPGIGMGGGGSGGGCEIDGIDSLCSFLGPIGDGYAVCPMGCSYIDSVTGGLMQYFAWSDGTAGYYAPVGAGSPFFSVQAAGLAAELNTNGESIAEDREYAGPLYVDANGKFSYVAAFPGEICAPGEDCHSDPHPEAIPDGTELAGLYHTHGGNSGNAVADEFFSPDDKKLAKGYGVPDFLATPQNRVLMFDPFKTCSPTSVLFGPRIPNFNVVVPVWPPPPPAIPAFPIPIR